MYYAATQSEAQLCYGDPVLIVGGGNSAGQAAMFLSQHASSCRLMIRGDDLGQVDVALPDRRARQPAAGRDHHRVRGRRAQGRAVAGGASWSTTSAPASATSSTPRRCSCSSAPIPAPTGCGATSRWTSTASCSTGRDLERRPAGRLRQRAAVLPGDQPARDLRRRRRALGLDQARRLGGRRGLDGRPPRPPAAGRGDHPGRGDSWPLDRVLARQLLDGDPAQLGELLERRAAAEAARSRWP